MKQHATGRTWGGVPGGEACGERLKPSQESRVHKRLDCYLELGLYPEGCREALRNFKYRTGHDHI